MTVAAMMATAAVFNLVCSGTHNQIEKGKALPDKPFIHTYRVDLGSGRYCLADCKQTQPIYQVTDTQIQFVRLERDGILVDVSVSRESGFYNSISNAPSGSGWSQGTCTRAPFTGFPLRKF